MSPGGLRGETFLGMFHLLVWEGCMGPKLVDIGDFLVPVPQPCQTQLGESSANSNYLSWQQMVIAKERQLEQR